MRTQILRKDWLCCDNGALLATAKVCREVLQICPAGRLAAAGPQWWGAMDVPQLEVFMIKTTTKTKPTRNAGIKPAQRAAAARTVKKKNVAPNSPKKAPSKQPSQADLPTATATGARSNSKQSRVLAMLRAIDGATIEAIMQATSWQQHSVRGFLAGVVRKKLNLNLASEVIDGTRRYWVKQEIIAGGANKSAKAA